MKSRKLALILSCIYCGLGQIYNGNILKGINFVIIYSALIASIFVPLHWVRVFGISALPFMWVVGMEDAYMAADRIIVNKKRWLLAVLPGIIISGILLYIQIAPDSRGPIHVSISKGDNNNPGTKEAPMKNIDKAVIAASAGGILLVAEGTYSGTLKIGHLIIGKPVKMYGGYSTDFSQRDVVKHPTLFQPGKKSGTDRGRPLLTLSNEVDGIVVDGFIFDMGMRNSYSSVKGKPWGVKTGMLLLPLEESDGGTVVERGLYIAAGNKGGNITISNNVFLNSAKFAIQGAIPAGAITITNNVFVSNRMAAIEVWGSTAKSIPSAEIAYNTMLFSWSRTKDFMDMGYGISMVDKMQYNIHHNIIGASVLSGIHSARFNKDEWVKLDNNIFFLSKQSDLKYQRGIGTSLDFPASEFEELEFASSSGNRTEIPRDYPINKAYLEGFLNVCFTREEDLRPNSHARLVRNLFGLSKSAQTSVTMFCNRYPWEESLELFGAVSGAGSQTDRWPLIKARVHRKILPDFLSRRFR